MDTKSVKTVVALIGIFSIMFSSMVSAQSVCRSAASDSDGDGFGWENNQTCIVGAMPVRQLSVCLSRSSDPDGDGFGWENNASCIVASSTPDTTTVTRRSSLPVCLSAASDPDGDGFGWESSASCVVSANSPPVPTVSIFTPMLATPGQTLLAEETVRLRLPACSDQRFDPDGDGFGWENSNSCTFLNAGDGGNSITDVILVTGQSNALGAETASMDPDSFVEELDGSVKRVYAFSENGWGIAGLKQIWDQGWYPRSDIAGQPANNFAFHFGKSVVRNDANSVIGIIMITAPGKPIAHWDSNGDFFAEIDSRVRNALNSLPGNPKVQGVLWHQGESDFYSTDYYSGKLDQLIGNFRGRSWFANDGVFICGETLNSPVNERLSRLNNDGDARTGCASSSGLESVGDDIHFNATSLRRLGARYAEKYRSLSR